MAKSASRQYSNSITSDGITVEKEYNEGEFEAPAIEFNINSEASTEAALTVIEFIPEGFNSDHIGFIEDQEEYWKVDEERNVLEYSITLEPGAEKSTLYGIHPKQKNKIPDFFDINHLVDVELEKEDEGESDQDTKSTDTETQSEPENHDHAPTAESKTEDGPLSNESENAQQEESEKGSVVEEIEEHGPNKVFESEPEEEQAPSPTPKDWQQNVGTKADQEESQEAHPTDAKESEDNSNENSDSQTESILDEIDGVESLNPADSVETVPQETTLEPISKSNKEAGEPATKDASNQLPQDGSVISQFLTEVESGNVQEEQIELLKEKLGVGLSPSEELDINYLLTQINRQEAYTDALKEYVDEVGKDRNRLNNLEQGLETVQKEMQNLDERMDRIESKQTEIISNVNTLSAHTETINSNSVKTQAAVSSLKTQVDHVQTEMQSIPTNISLPSETIDEDVEELEEEIEQLQREMKLFKQGVASVFSDGH